MSTCTYVCVCAGVRMCACVLENEYMCSQADIRTEIKTGALGRHTQYDRLQSTCHTHHLSRLPFGFFAPLWRADQARTIAVPLHCQTQRCALGL